jgi:hypothetical protein
VNAPKNTDTIACTVAALGLYPIKSCAGIELRDALRVRPARAGRLLPAIGERGVRQGTGLTFAAGCGSNRLARRAKLGTVAPRRVKGCGQGEWGAGLGVRAVGNDGEHGEHEPQRDAAHTARQRLGDCREGVQG